VGENDVEWIDTTPADLGGYRSNVIVSNGIPTRYYDVGSGTPLVLLHGAGWRGESSGNTFVPVFPYLSRHYRVIAPDKLASGLTGNPKSPEGYTQDAQVEHMSAFIRDLDLGDEVLVLGQSRGGYLATRMALENQDIVKQLAIVDSATLAPEVGDFEERRRRLFRGQGMDGKDMSDPDSVRAGVRVQHERLSFSYDHITDDFIDAKVYMESTDKSRETVRVMDEQGGNEIFLASLSVQKEDTLRRLEAGELDMPVLIYWGADDPSAILEQGQALFQIMRKNNDRTRMLVANRAGHFHYREHPEEFSYNVRNFFEFWRAR
jgi:2-hydroxy-6-oxonona-2,4-dienedioate hydrolase